MKSGRGLRTTVVLVGFAVASLTSSCALWPHTHTPSSGSSAIAGLRAYLGAQGTFQRKGGYGMGEPVYANPEDGTGFTDLYRIGGPDGSGREFKFIDLAFARATSPESTKAGYWYIDIVADTVTGPYDYTQECGLCAVPAVHGKSGIYTYIIDLTGTVYKKDNGGRPVTVWPDVEEEGWVPVGG